MRQIMLLGGRVVICLALSGCTVSAGEPAGGAAGAANMPQAGVGSVIPGVGGSMGGAGTAGAGPSAGGGLGGAGAPTLGGAAGAVAAGGAGGAMTGGGHMPTAGCGKTNMDEPGKDVLHNIMVAGVARRYWTRLPTEAPQDKPFPLVFWGPG